jgi:hypothetical protein
MKKKHLLIGLIIVVLSSYYAFRNVSPEELFTALGAVHYIYIIPAILAVAMTFYFRALRWSCLVSSVKTVRASSLVSPLMVGFMANILPARAGEIIRAYLLGKKEDITFSASFATIIVERLMDMIVFLLLLVGVLIFSSDVLTGGHTGGAESRLMGYMIKFGWVSFIGTIGLITFVVLLQYKNEWAVKIVKLFTMPLPLRWKQKIEDMVHSFTEGLRILRNLRGVIFSLGLSLLVWISIVVAYYPLNLAFGIDAELPTISSILIIALTICIFISLFPTPAFLGAFQAACVVALHEIFGVSKAVAASYGIIAWLVAMGFIIVVGFIFIVKDNISFSELAAGTEHSG